MPCFEIFRRLVVFVLVSIESPSNVMSVLDSGCTEGRRRVKLTTGFVPCSCIDSV